MAEIFRGNPYEHSVKGTSATLSNLQLLDIKKQYRKLFLPNQTQLAIEYSENTDYFQKKIGGAWGIWRKKKSVPFTFRSPKVLDQSKILLVDAPDSESLFRWGKISVERDASEYYTLKILEQYLMLLLPDWAEQITTQSQIQASSALDAVQPWHGEAGEGQACLSPRQESGGGLTSAVTGEDRDESRSPYS